MTLRYQTGFTLIELLVVIGIIGILGSSLFLLDLLSGHEPENRKCLEINGTTFRFMESGHEPENRKCLEINGTTFRFMESLLFLAELLMGDEPTGLALTRPSGTLSHRMGEGWGEGRFMGSLLLPALSMAKAKAGSARCLGNLRQIGIGLRLYADENEGRLPRLSADARAPGLTNATGAVMPRLLASATSPELFRCPQDRKGVFQQTGASYEWNQALNGRLLHRLNREDTGPGDHATYLMRDAEPWHARGTRNAGFADGHAGKVEPNCE